MKAFIDFGALWVTVVWFAVLIAWPGAVVLAATGWSWSSFALRHRSRLFALVSAVVAAIVVVDGLVVFLEIDQVLLASLPSQSRPLAQLVVIALPWLALFVGAFLIFVGLLRQRAASSNRTPHADARDVPPSANGGPARAGGRER